MDVHLLRILMLRIFRRIRTFLLKTLPKTSQPNVFQHMFCQICGKPNNNAQKRWYQYDYSHVDEDVPTALAAMSSNDIPDPNWYADIGATAQMTNNLSNLLSCSSYTRTDKFYVSDGKGLRISVAGGTVLSSLGSEIHLQNVLVVPNLKNNLLPVSQLNKDDFCVLNLPPLGSR